MINVMKLNSMMIKRWNKKINNNFLLLIAKKKFQVKKIEEMSNFLIKINEILITKKCDRAKNS